MKAFKSADTWRFSNRNSSSIQITFSKYIGKKGSEKTQVRKVVALGEFTEKNEEDLRKDRLAVGKQQNEKHIPVDELSSFKQAFLTDAS